MLLIVSLLPPLPTHVPEPVTTVYLSVLSWAVAAPSASVRRAALMAIAFLLVLMRRL